MHPQDELQRALEEIRLLRDQLARLGQENVQLRALLVKYTLSSNLSPTSAARHGLLPSLLSPTNRMELENQAQRMPHDAAFDRRGSTSSEPVSSSATSMPSAPDTPTTAPGRSYARLFPSPPRAGQEGDTMAVRAMLDRTRIGRPVEESDDDPQRGASSDSVVPGQGLGLW
ncbi:hypothetical protein ACM66B_002981 [Microbotryomycetes sp. NB124-2]